MRELKIVAAAVAVVFSLTGCTVRERRWSTCAVVGAVVGATVGGVTGGAAVNNGKRHPSNEERGAGIGGGIAAGALIGGLLGHVICDPVKPAPAPPPVAQAPPPPPPPAPAKGATLATLGGANFDFNKAEVKPEGRDILDRVVKTLKEHSEVKVVVEGHTDSVGSDAYNKKLSERRAEAVKRYLVREGVDPSRVRTAGYGKSRPVADNDTAEGRAKNRRAEVIVE